MPGLKDFYQQASRGDDFVMLGLSLDDTDEVVRRFIEKHQLPWLQARIGRLSRLAASYGVPDQAPFYVLVGAEGKVLVPPSNFKEIVHVLEKASAPKDSSR